MFETRGRKIHVKEGTDRILGATIIVRHAGEMIDGLSLAICSGIRLRAVAQVIQTYSTQATAIKMAANAYTAAVESINAHSQFYERSLRSKRNMSANARAIARSLDNCLALTLRESDQMRQTAEPGRKLFWQWPALARRGSHREYPTSRTRRRARKLRGQD
jgi:hypothetical protein